MFYLHCFVAGGTTPEIQIDLIHVKYFPVVFNTDMVIVPVLFIVVGMSVTPHKRLSRSKCIQLTRLTLNPAANPGARSVPSSLLKLVKEKKDGHLTGPQQISGSATGINGNFNLCVLNLLVKQHSSWDQYAKFYFPSKLTHWLSGQVFLNNEQTTIEFQDC